MYAIDVSVIVPVLNEEKYISNCLDSIIAQDYPKLKLEVILVDGDSQDATVKIIKRYMEKYEFIKLFQNPQKTVQHALNIGIENSVGKYIVRMDAHASYASDYISQCVYYLEKTQADNVGGPTIAQGRNKIQKIIASLYGSPFALGGSRHYDKNFEGYADTVSWGAFRRETLIKIGIYDKQLIRSEDDDLNFRIIKNGGKIFITPKIKSIYYPKDTFRKLFEQYFSYGVWKIAVMKKHGKPLRLVQMVPMAFVSFIIIFGLLSLFSGLALVLLLSVMSIYLLLNLLFSIKNKNRENRIAATLGLMWAHLVVHISYGFGFWVGIFKFWNKDFN